MLPLSSFITSTSSSLVVRHRGLPLPPPPLPPPPPPPPPLPPRRHSHSPAALPPSRQTPRPRRQSHPAPQSTTTSSNSHMAALRSTSFRQAELDQSRQAMEARLDAPSLCPLVATALRETVLRSILKDREKARTCMTGLLLGNGEAAAARLEQLHTSQCSQQELLQRCHDALAFAPLVSQLESYARDRNLPGECTSYCLDLGNKSWVRIKTTQTHFALPRSSPLFQHFDGCTLEVTRSIALADLKPDMTGSALYRLFQPVEATLVSASLAGQELQVVLEVGSSEGGLYGVDVGGGGGGGGGGGAFRLACYGYRTFYPKHTYQECEGLVKTWAATLPPSTQHSTQRHILGVSVPVPHPILVADRSGPLEVIVSIAS